MHMAALEALKAFGAPTLIRSPRNPQANIARPPCETLCHHLHRWRLDGD